MLGFAILLGFNMLGVLIQALFALPLPGNVIGLVLFVAALALKWIRLEWVEQSAQFLLKHMMLFFAPFIVGVISVASLMEGQWAAIAAGLIISTLIGMIVTGASTQLLIKRAKERSQ